MRLLSLRWTLCIGITASACTVDVNHGATVYSCLESPLCPSGYECVEGLCRAEPGDGGTGVDAGVDAGPTLLVRGDTLYYSFDDYQQTRLAHDRSGNRLDGQLRGPTQAAGRFGNALQFDGNDIDIIDHPLLFSGSQVTIEAQVLHLIAGQDAVIYGDHTPGVGTNRVEYSLGIDDQDRLEFVTNAGCDTEAVSFQSVATVAAGDWHHVAVVWDALNIVFYIDGVQSGQVPHAAEACESQGNRSYRVGRRRDGSGAFSGLIDELKVSGLAKSQADIVASSTHDSSAIDLSRCGDALIETEICERGNACCSETCTPSLEGSACASGGLCNAVAACAIEGGRITDGLAVLYEFNEGTGAIVGDSSGVEPALDLTIDDELAVVWGNGALTVAAPVLISSLVNADKVTVAARASDEISVEAWVIAANNNQGGPARVVTISPDTNNRNVTLGQEAETFVTRVRSNLATNGLPVIDTPVADAAAGQLVHLVVTRSVAGDRNLYVNGVLRSSNKVAGVLDNWGDFPLFLANEATRDRPWLGDLHLAAVYTRALTIDDVARNFAAGPD